MVVEVGGEGEAGIGIGVRKERVWGGRRGAAAVRRCWDLAKSSIRCRLSERLAGCEDFGCARGFGKGLASATAHQQDVAVTNRRWYVCCRFGNA